MLIKTQLILHGNIYDRLPFLQAGVSGRKGRLTYLPLRRFLYKFLQDKQFANIAFFDIVDRITCETKEESESFARLLKTVEKSECPGDPCSIRSSTGQESDQGLPDTMYDDINSLRTALRKIDTPTVVVLDFASRLLSIPDRLQQAENRMFLALAKCAQEARAVQFGDGIRRNLSILVCDKLNDLPAWMYLNNPLVHSIELDLPDDDERRRYFDFDLTRFHQSDRMVDDRDRMIGHLVSATRGLCNYDLQNLQALSETRDLPVKSLGDIDRLIDLYKFGIRENPWEKLKVQKSDLLANAHAELAKHVKGQDRAINAVVDILKRAVMGLSGVQHSSGANKPRGVLFFAGPTGVGKTELAKSLARLLFEDESTCLRFDMSEYASSHSDQKLMGAPPGYVGYAAGGQLTNAIKKNPFSVLLFDEIEKADPTILDKFLQILEDGRMTDGKGETVYFSEAIIIFTSNLGTYVEERDELTGARTRRANVLPYIWRCSNCGRIEVAEDQPAFCEGPNCDSSSLLKEDTPYEFLQNRILEAIEDEFKVGMGRPELFNRFGNNFIVFDYIRPAVLKQIVEKNLDSIRTDLRSRKGIEIEFADELVERVVALAEENLEMGARGVGNLLETRVVNPLARYLFDSGIKNGKKLRVLDLGPDDTNGRGPELKIKVR